MLALFLALSAHASSLDLIEVGGAFGTPAATDANATFWNPAGLAVGEGTHINLEVAPTLATVNVNIDDPNWGGEDVLQFNGIVPFLGVSSDFGYAPLGVGLSLSVPQARGGTSTQLPPEDVFGPGGGPARFHLKDGGSQVIMGSLAASYHIAELVSFGAGVHMNHSTWHARVDTETMTELSDALCEEAGLCEQYEDSQIGDPNYATELRFDNLTDTTFTFSVGTYVTPIPQLGISASYMHGTSYSHSGPVSAAFGCPPEEDFFGRFGAESLGLCNAEMSGDAVVAYGAPWRTNIGFRVMPLPDPDHLQIELMGAAVGHKAFRDYDITTDMDPSTVSTFTEEDCAEGTENDEGETPCEVAAGRASQQRLWARDNRNSFWIGLDAKGRVLDEKLMIGGRVTYDKAAVPIEVMGPNNQDFDEIILQPVVSVSPIPQLEIGVSYSRHIMMARTVTDSAYGITLGEERNEDRYFYTDTPGTYSGGINRIGLSLRGHFKKRDDKIIVPVTDPEPVVVPVDEPAPQEI